MPQAPHVFTDYLDESVRVVALVGEHDVSARQSVLAALEWVIAPGTKVIVDLSTTEFIDSSVLNVLIAAHKRAERTPRASLAVVVSPDTPPARVFEMIDAPARFPILASLDEAIQSSQPQGANAGIHVPRR
jgi:anti-anti-sigma factor